MRSRTCSLPFTKYLGWHSITQPLLLIIFIKMHGNTQSKHWVFTVNNWTAHDEETLREVAEASEYLVYGYEEAPETGTKHLQGYVAFKTRHRFAAVRRIMPQGTHIEMRRGTAAEAADYCKKEGVFQEFGVLPNDTCVTEIDRFKAWVTHFYDEHKRVPGDQELAVEWSSLWLRQRRNCLDLARMLCPPPKLQEGALRVWQSEVNEILQLDPDDRTILFIVDEEGGKGKTWFQRWYLSEHPEDAQILSVGKRDDVAHAIDPQKSVFMFNIPRNGMEFFNYALVEMIKDRLVFSPKYESRMKVLDKNPHVLVFCNEEPDLTKMTEDRYHIIRV